MVLQTTLLGRRRRCAALKFEQTSVDPVRPVIHGVFGVTPLPLGCGAHRDAACPLVDRSGKQLSGGRVRGLHLGFRGAHEGITSGHKGLGGVYDPELRNYHGDGTQTGRGGIGVNQRHLQFEHPGSSLIHQGEVLLQVLFELIVEVGRQRMLISGRHFTAGIVPEFNRLRALSCCTGSTARLGLT